ncbi:hypothetical protein VDGE_08174 [Verticillium dahliae]|uniref:Xylose isomerase-like TIM barrel domain-containing protein n=1 Tax=Verticillium dahliae TaxID=27337 RepID=A0A444RZR2_VERDA|nr:hypothetical protein VDGE_08174 [Verticillium dahliae]
MPSQLAISTMSLGRCFAGHALEHKLDMAAKYNYRGIELWHEDLMDVAERYTGGSALVSNQLAAAHDVRRLCEARNLHILCLQPFQHFEGLLDRAQHARRLDELRIWFQLAHALQTDLIQIPSNVLPREQVSGDLADHIADLREVADMGAAATPPLRFSFESLGWGAVCDTWEASWEVVRGVDRANFGLCLDTFNICARVYADPTAATGRVARADEAVRASMERLVATVDAARVFYVQVVDAERLRAPLGPGHAFYDAAQPARMSWSRNCRLFYGEQARGGYLPVRAVASAIFQGLGFEGWVSLELFNRRMSQPDPGVPEELAKRGAASFAKLVRDMRMSVEEPVLPVTASL